MVEWFNAAPRDDPYIEILVAHPDDRDRLARLRDYRDLRPNAYGPFRYRQSRGLFD